MVDRPLPGRAGGRMGAWCETWAVSVAILSSLSSLSPFEPTARWSGVSLPPKRVSVPSLCLSISWMPSRASNFTTLDELIYRTDLYFLTSSFRRKSKRSFGDGDRNQPLEPFYLRQFGALLCAWTGKKKGKDAGLCCGSRLLEGRSVCLCWEHSKPKGP